MALYKPNQVENFDNHDPVKYSIIICHFVCLRGVINISVQRFLNFQLFFYLEILITI